MLASFPGRSGSLQFNSRSPPSVKLERDQPGNEAGDLALNWREIGLGTRSPPSVKLERDQPGNEAISVHELMW